MQIQKRNDFYYFVSTFKPKHSHACMTVGTTLPTKTPLIYSVEGLVCVLSTRDLQLISNNEADGREAPAGPLVLAQSHRAKENNLHSEFWLWGRFPGRTGHICAFDKSVLSTSHQRKFAKTISHKLRIKRVGWDRKKTWDCGFHPISYWLMVSARENAVENRRVYTQQCIPASGISIPAYHPAYHPPPHHPRLPPPITPIL